VDSKTFTIAVANAAPTVRITSPASGSTFKVGNSVSVSSSFADKGVLDRHTCTINWGDGRQTTGTISESGGSGTCAGSAGYSAPGTYAITVTVRDDAGASATSTVFVNVTGKGKTATTIYAFSGSATIRSAKPAAKSSAKSTKAAVTQKNAKRDLRPAGSAGGGSRPLAL
jgi:hypothetical protein